MYPDVEAHCRGSNTSLVTLLLFFRRESFRSEKDEWHLHTGGGFPPPGVDLLGL